MLLLYPNSIPLRPSQKITSLSHPIAIPNFSRAVFKTLCCPFFACWFTKPNFPWWIMGGNNVQYIDWIARSPLKIINQSSFIKCPWSPYEQSPELHVGSLRGHPKKLERSHRLPHICTKMMYGKLGGRRLQEILLIFLTPERGLCFLSDQTSWPQDSELSEEMLVRVSGF